MDGGRLVGGRLDGGRLDGGRLVGGGRLEEGGRLVGRGREVGWRREGGWRESCLVGVPVVVVDGACANNCGVCMMVWCEKRKNLWCR